MSSKVGNYIKSLRKDKGLTQEELGNMIGVKKAAVQKWESGMVQNLKRNTIKQLSEIFEVSPASFIDDDDPIESNATILPQEKIRLIPVYESVSAGFGAYADNYILEYIPLFISSNEEAHNTLCIKVQGNSMYPKIEDGDSIQVLKQDWCESGQVAIVLIDDENAVVKKVEYDKSSITLLSFNPEYAPRVFKGADRDRLKILGIVRKVIKDI